MPDPDDMAKMLDHVHPVKAIETSEVFVNTFTRALPNMTEEEFLSIPKLTMTELAQLLNEALTR